MHVVIIGVIDCMSLTHSYTPIASLEPYMFINAQIICNVYINGTIGAIYDPSHVPSSFRATLAFGLLWHSGSSGIQRKNRTGVLKHITHTKVLQTVPFGNNVPYASWTHIVSTAFHCAWRRCRSPRLTHKNRSYKHLQVDVDISRQDDVHKINAARARP